MGGGKTLTRRLLLLAPLASAEASDRVHFDRVGPARIGMDEAALRKAIGPKLRIEGVYAGWGDPHLGMLLVEGKLARFDIIGGNWRTVGGARVGSREYDLRRIFKKKLETGPHPYDPRGRTLLVRSKGFALRFVTDGDVVESFQAGLEAAVS